MRVPACLHGLVELLKLERTKEKQKKNPATKENPTFKYHQSEAAQHITLMSETERLFCHVRSELLLTTISSFSKAKTFRSITRTKTDCINTGPISKSIQLQ